MADVTTTDSGTGSETSTDDSSTADSGTPGTDSGTAEGGCATAACTVDASIAVVGVGADGGEVENTACEMCIGTNCAAQQCNCLSDPAMIVIDDAGATDPACGVYAICVYQTLLGLLQTNDAGATGEAADLAAAEAACSTQTAVSSCSEVLGKGLIGCIAGHCASECVQ